LFPTFAFALPGQYSFTSIGRHLKPAGPEFHSGGTGIRHIDKEAESSQASPNPEERIDEPAPHLCRPGPGRFDVNDRMLLPPVALLPATLLHVVLLSTGAAPSRPVLRTINQQQVMSNE
jgi:hypothetical protein